MHSCFSAGGISKDMLPGPYPTTPEQMAAAAKKYNMTLEDYKPMPDNGEGYVFKGVLLNHRTGARLTVVAK